MNILFHVVGTMPDLIMFKHWVPPFHYQCVSIAPAKDGFVLHISWNWNFSLFLDRLCYPPPPLAE